MINKHQGFMRQPISNFENDTSSLGDFPENIVNVVSPGKFFIDDQPQVDISLCSRYDMSGHPKFKKTTPHIKSIIAKLNSTLGAVRGARPYLNKPALTSIYYSLMQSRIQYCVHGGPGKHEAISPYYQNCRLCATNFSVVSMI